MSQSGRSGRQRLERDDDPLTSPSFPRIPADSRSYRSGRAGAPSGGARAPEPYAAPTQQFSGYPPAAQLGSGAGLERGSADPYAYGRTPPGGQDSYPAATPPAPIRPASAGNPYGSYVTPETAAAPPGYGEYPGAHQAAQGNGGGYLPSAPPAGAGPAGNGYWQQPSVAPGHPGPGPSAYRDNPPQPADPLATAAYPNGYHQTDQAGYQPDRYAGGLPDPLSDPVYPPRDPYGRDQGDRYPGYGARS
jgi:hypothetical protein